jgi:predicted Ser/Thr protein kinase
MSTPGFIGRYQVRECLGQGGMGVLHLALDPAIDRLVALKVLRVDQPEIRERFLREARLAARLQHPNIVTIFDVGEHDGQPFIAMEYISGETLGEMIARRAALAPTRKLELIIEACRGLAYAHRHGIVHRDVKPANLMISRESGALKVLDFGIARVVDSNLTQAGVAMGTPSYMSPEQHEGRPVDHRSDVFALGLVLYEVLGYRRAFTGETPHAVRHRVISTRPSSILEIDPSVDPALARIIDRAIEKRAEDRYPDLDELRGDLHRVKQRLDAELASATVIGEGPAPAEPIRRGGVAHIAARRAAQVGANLDRGAAALEAGDLAAAQAAADDAEMLGPDDPRVQALLDRIARQRDAIAIAGWLADAEAAMRAGALTAAAGFVDRALLAAPGHAAALELRTALQQAMEARERSQDRARAVARALEQGETHLAQGRFEVALRATSEALGFDPESPAALELRGRIQRAVAASIDEGIALARRDAQAERFASALRRLEALSPRDTRVGVVEDEIRQAWQQAERRREVEEADRRARAEAAQRREQADGHLRVARERAAVHDYAAALDAVDAAIGADPSCREASPLRAEIDRAWTVWQRRREREERVSRALVRARALADQERPRDALNELDPFLDDSAAAALAATLRQALVELEARARADAARQASEAHDRRVVAAIAHAHDLIGQQRRDDAIASLEAFTPADDRIAATIARLRRDARSREESERASAAARASETADLARREADEGRLGAAIARLERARPRHPVTDAALDALRATHERLAHDASARALTLAAADREAEAFALLQQFDPPHAIVANALIRLRGESAARDARKLADVAARQRTDDAAAQQAALAAWADAECVRARTALDRERFEEATAIAHAVLSRLPDAFEAAQILDDAVAAQATAEAAAARDAEIRRAIQQADAALDAGDVTMSRAQLDAAAAVGADEAQVAALRQRIVAAEAEREASQRRALHDRRAATLVGDARARFAAGDEDAAIRRLELFAPPHPLVTTTLEELRGVRSAREAQREAMRAAARSQVAETAVRGETADEALGLFGDEHDAPNSLIYRLPIAPDEGTDAPSTNPMAAPARPRSRRRLLATAAIAAVVIVGTAVSLLQRETPVVGGQRSDAAPARADADDGRPHNPAPPAPDNAPSTKAPVASAPPDAALVSLVIDATPWAQVSHIARVDTADAVPLAGERNTPYVAQLPAGAYDVTVRRFDRSLRRRVTVTPGANAPLVFAFEPVDVDAYLRRLGS